MDEQVVMYPCSEILLSSKKEQSTDTHTRGRTQKHAEQKKPDPKESYKIPTQARDPSQQTSAQWL